MPRRTQHTIVPISEEEFENEYKPIPKEDGSTMYDHDEAVMFQRDQVWSIVEGEREDFLYALPGYRIVNVVGYTVTEKFWESELIEAVYHDPRNK